MIVLNNSFRLVVFLFILRTAYYCNALFLSAYFWISINEAEKLPQAQLLIANLLIEYIGYVAFQRAVLQTAPEFVSCVIQINTDEEQWMSESPYLRAFDRLDEVHHQMEEETLTAAMEDIGYSLILQETYPLPNGKALVRLDFKMKVLR